MKLVIICFLLFPIKQITEIKIKINKNINNILYPCIPILPIKKGVEKRIKTIQGEGYNPIEDDWGQQEKPALSVKIFL